MYWAGAACQSRLVRKHFCKKETLEWWEGGRKTLDCLWGRESTFPPKNKRVSLDWMTQQGGHVMWQSGNEVEENGLKSAAAFKAITRIWSLLWVWGSCMSREASLINVLAGSALLRSESTEQKSNWKTGVGAREPITTENHWISDQVTGDQLWKQPWDVATY